LVSYGGDLLDLDRAIRIINYDIDENASESEQLEAFKVFFKELFDTDIQNSDGGYKSVHDIFLEASKKFHSKTENITM
jgi:hypothetical protein